MTFHTRQQHHKFFKIHLLLGAVLGASAVILMHWTSWWVAVGAVAGVHVSVAIAVHMALALAGGGILVSLVRSHARPRGTGHGSPGATLHSARFYDWLAAAYTLGREARIRERTLDIAEVVTGEAVLDVGCGTGTLALAARRRVGAGGSVYGIDASEEMIERARAKSARQGLPVAFEVAAAQSLPFADAAFDVVLCSLALHHLPEDARVGALAEMRRVLKPEGRALIVEFSRGRGVWALLHPVALLHARKSPRILDEAEALMKRAGFASVATGPLGFGGLGYALGHCT
ncbi:MAG: class I SAM-dependent methyltransferase [Isosphaeraceae bacterium]|nr:class I SAM-dependent methyltransferase [Isosphaeraceae bacterium]